MTKDLLSASCWSSMLTYSFRNSSRDDLTPRVMPAMLDEWPNDDDLIADLRDVKWIVKCLARGLGNLQCHVGYAQTISLSQAIS